METQSIEHMYGTSMEDYEEFYENQVFGDVGAYHEWRDAPPRVILTAEQEMQRAILEASMDDVRGLRSVKGMTVEQRREDARAWFTEVGDPEYPFSFRAVCANLNLDLDAVRGAALKILSESA